MARTVLPFSTENKIDEQHMENLYGDLHKSLPPTFQKVTESSPFLIDYLRMLPIAQVGMPQYYPELQRKLGDNKEPNIIYPTENNDIFVHILADSQDSRNTYIPLEPTLTLDLSPLIDEVEDKLLDLGTKLARIENVEEKGATA